MSQVYPPAARLFQIADAAENLASAFRKHWILPGASIEQNTGRLVLPLDDGCGGDVKRTATHAEKVRSAFSALSNLVSEVSPGELLDLSDTSPELAKRMAEPEIFKTEPIEPGEPVTSWSFDVREAVAIIKDVLGKWGAQIASLRPPDPLDPRAEHRSVSQPEVFVDLEDVEQLEYAAGVFREAAGGVPGTTRKKRKRGRYKTDYDRDADEKLSLDWQAAKSTPGGARTVADFCKARGLNGADVRAALDRHRKRRK